MPRRHGLAGLVEAEIGAQVDPLDVLVAGKIRWSTAAKDGAVVDDVGAVGDLQGFTDVVVGD